MNKEHSLEEDVRHGTQERPLTAIHFTTGPGTVYPEYFYVQRHWHHNIEILKVLKGSYTVELNLENYVLAEGDICIINSGELHEIKGIGADTVHDVVIFNPHILEFTYQDEFQQALIAPLIAHTYSLPHMIHPEDAVYAEMSSLFKQMMWISMEEKEGWYFRVKLLLLEFLNILNLNHRVQVLASVQSAPEKERIDRYKRIVSYIEEHFMEKVTLEHLAEAAQCNPQYLCHFFKEIAGVSPIQYLISHRIGKAQEMLTNTTKSVLEVSLDCGFENVSYFIRQFKRSVGATPREYRKEEAVRMVTVHRQACKQ